MGAMKASAAALALGASLVLAAEAARATPVQKVLELMEGMLQKGKDEKQAEQVQFAKYKQFCDDTSVQKQQAIAEAADTIERLQADIQKYSADAARLTKEIVAHDDDISTWTGDVKAVTKVRALEAAHYEATHKDYSESVEALRSAIEVLKKQAHDREQASFVQLSSLKGLSLIPKAAKQVIETFLQQGDPADGLAVKAPEAYGYEFQSQGIIEMLQGLLGKFTAERTELEKEETTNQHAFEMLMQDVNQQIQQAEKDSTQKAATKAKKLQNKADAEGGLQDASSTKRADEHYLSDLVATCEQKASDFVSRQQLRSEELEAISEAIDIMAGEGVTGATRHMPKLLLQRGASLAALRVDQQGRSQLRLAEFLHDKATELNSRLLESVATHAAADPFLKVKKLIKDLLVRLMEEANEEAQHKGWCDAELATNEQTRKEKTESVETLHAEIDALEASVSKLAADIAELTKAVAELDAAMAKSTTLRAEESAENAQTVADAKAAQEAVAQALTVLGEFYSKAGEATALVQEQPEAPPIFDEPYKGMQAEKGGVVGMLEVIQSDFARLEADTASAEESAKQEYDTFMTDTQIDKAAKSQDIEHKTSKKKNQEQALVLKKSDLEGTQKELDAALAYFDKLKPSCVDAGVSYEDRGVRRRAEVESLREALRIINGED